MENAMFPMEYLRVTQRAGVGSHLGSKALDFGGRDGSCDRVLAPFSGTVVRTRKNANGEMYLQSDQPVRWADGTMDYLTVTFMHDSSFNVPEGAHVIQGQYIYDEGGMGGGNPCKFANHLHMEVSRGRVAARQIRNGYGVYCTSNQVDIDSALMLGDDVTILAGGGYNWRRRSDATASLGTLSADNTFKARSGDSWWRIAAQQLGSGLKCYALAKANGKTIFSVIHPGDVLTLSI